LPRQTVPVVVPAWKAFVFCEVNAGGENKKKISAANVFLQCEI
jgi:hypothetical protein